MSRKNFDKAVSDMFGVNIGNHAEEQEEFTDDFAEALNAVFNEDTGVTSSNTINITKATDCNEDCNEKSYTHICFGTTITGNITSDGVVEIYGTVNGDINAAVVKVSGAVIGSITASDCITIKNGAYVKGKIKSKNLECEHSADLDLDVTVGEIDGKKVK